MGNGGDVSVVVLAGDGGRLGVTLGALARCGLSDHGGEVVVVRRWPGPELPERLSAGQLAVRRIDAAVASDTAAVNAGLAAAHGDVIVLLCAGDVPGDQVLAGHAQVIAGGAAAVVGGLAGPWALRDGWAGAWPSGVPAPPVRHVAFARGALAEADGLDERLPHLEVAVVDLLARVAAGGRVVEVRRDLAVRAADSGARELAEAGRSAHALALLLAERGDRVRLLGPRRARATLRWTEPALRALAGSSDSGGRISRLARRAAFARGLGRFPPPIAATARGGLAPRPLAGSRPSISVVVPFAGTRGEAEEILDALAAIRRQPGDEVIVADNSRAAVVPARPGIAVVRAEGEWSSYHARNTGWRAAHGEWLLFVDSDCRPAPDIIDAYFAPAPADDAGAVAGGVLPAPARGWSARFSESTEVLSQARSLGREERPYAVTANLLARRAALERLGGFAETVRSGGDTDFSWRLLDSGWRIEHRPAAAVLHAHRTSMRALLRQYARYGAGAAWLGRRYPGALHGWPTFPRATPRIAVADLVAGRFELALVRLTELMTTGSAWAGAQRSNRPAIRGRDTQCATVAFAGAYPDADGDPEVAQRVAALGPDTAVEARRRPRRFLHGNPGVAVAYAEDDAPVDRLAGLWWLACRPGGPREVMAAALRGRTALRVLGADAALARRVADRRPSRLLAVDDDQATAVAVARAGDLLGVPIEMREIRTGEGASA